MERFKLYSNGKGFIRFIADVGVITKQIYIHDCIRGISVYTDPEYYSDYVEVEEKQLWEALHVNLQDFEECDAIQKKIARDRYNYISPILSFIENNEYRFSTMKLVAQKHGLTVETVRKYLRTYLTFMNLTALVPHMKIHEQELTQTQKNFRWGLNKFYYTGNKNSLFTAYELMLKEKYTDINGKLVDDYPKFHQFVYFYKKTKKISNQLISREGLTYYQRNKRPLWGHVNDFAPFPGTAAVDQTTLDVYLVNESGQLVGRPYLYLAVDCYSTMILGYYLGWEGGMYGVRQMLQNCITNKVEHCKKFGVSITKEQWDIAEVPSRLLTDRGSEFYCAEFNQLTDIGVEIINAPCYRPELKGPVEKALNLLQDMFKPHLQYKGVVNPDFQERGVRDYRKDARLTIEQFERILVRCIVAYNTTRIVRLPYVVDTEIEPFAYTIFNKRKSVHADAFIKVDGNYLNKVLLNRTHAIIKRNGIEIFKLHYKRKGFNNRALEGGKVKVAYNPEDTSNIYLYEDGDFTKFTLIDTVFDGISFKEANNMIKRKQNQFKNYETTKIQGDLDVISSINSVVSSSVVDTHINTTDVRKTREVEILKAHKKLIIEDENND